MVWSQEFHCLAPRTIEESNNRIKMLHLNEEEHFAVCDWLVRHGYADERIMPNSEVSHAAPPAASDKPTAQRGGVALD